MEHMEHMKFMDCDPRLRGHVLQLLVYANVGVMMHMLRLFSFLEVARTHR
jgi:hypothetical protein